MAKEQEAPTTTMSVSRVFADMVNALAREAGETVREYCDRELTQFIRPQAKKAIEKQFKKKMQAVGGES